MYRILIATASLMLLALFALSCSGNEATDLPQGDAGSPAVESAVPAGVDPQLWSKLTTELTRVLAAEGTAKRSSAVAAGAGSAVADLELSPSGGVGSDLSWSYRNQGDYDLNGVVTIADLTPIGIHFGARFVDDDWQAAQLADGDGNGEVNIGDVTPIGQNFGGQVEGYEVQGRNTIVPDTEFQLVERYPFAAGVPASGLYPAYERELGLLISGSEFRVLPYLEDGGNYTYGAPSNVVRASLAGADPWPIRAANVGRTCLSRFAGPLNPDVAWTLELEGTGFFYGGPVADDSRNIYLCTARAISSLEDGTGKLYCISSDGDILWSYSVDSPLLMTPGVSPRGNIVFGDIAGRVYSMSADGKLLWRTEIVGTCLGASVLFDSSSAVYLNTFDLVGGVGTLYKLSPDGAIEWSKPNNTGKLTPPMLDGDGRIVFPSSDTEFTFLLEDGTPDDTLVTGDVSSFFNHPMIAANTFVGSLSSPDELLILPLAVAIPNNVPLPRNVSGGPSFNPDGNYVIGTSDTPSGDRELHLVDPAGVFLWNLPLALPAQGEIVVDSAGHMYFLGAEELAEEFITRFYCVGSDQTLFWDEDLEGKYALYPIILDEGALLIPLISTVDPEGGNTTLMLLRDP